MMCCTHGAHLAVRAGAGLGERRSRVGRAVHVDPGGGGGRAGRGARGGGPPPPRAESVDEGVDEPLLRLAAGRLVDEGEALPGDLLHELGPADA